MTSSTLASPAPAAEVTRVLIVPKVLAGAAPLAGVDTFATFERAARWVALSPDLAPSTRRETFDAASGSLGRAIAECDVDIGCIAARAEAAGFDRTLELLVNLELEPPVIIGQIIDGRGKVLASAFAEVPRDVRAIDAAIDEQTKTMLAAANPTIGGQLQVTTAPRDATVEIVGWPELEGELILPAGVYTVVARADGHEEARATATVTAGETTQVALELEPESGGVASSPWLWIGIGAAVLIGGGAAATYLALSGDDAPLTLCQSRMEAQCR